jgi:chromosome segregation ATPase
MKVNEIKNIINQVIAEAKEKKEALPKSGGKLVHLKKELASLKQMQESVSQLTMNEASAQPVVAEYAHMQKYVNELEKIKMASAKLSEMLGNQIGEVENKISAETQKIKEMMGLVEPVEEKKAKKVEKTEKAEPKKAVKEAQKSNEIEWVSSDFSPIEGIKVKKGDKGEIVKYDTGDQYLVKFNKHRFYANTKDFK